MGVGINGIMGGSGGGEKPSADEEGLTSEELVKGNPIRVCGLMRAGPRGAHPHGHAALNMANVECLMLPRFIRSQHSRT